MEELISQLKEKNVLKSSLVEEAFAIIDRKDFVPEELKAEAYIDTALAIGLSWRPFSRSWASLHSCCPRSAICVPYLNERRSGSRAASFSLRERSWGAAVCRLVDPRGLKARGSLGVQGWSYTLAGRWRVVNQGNLVVDPASCVL